MILKMLLTISIFLSICQQNISAGEIEQKAFIERFYQNILGRESDETGMNTWLQRIQTNSATDLALGFFRSAEFANLGLANEEFIDILYQTLFNRVADDNGKLNWLNKLNQGRSKESIMFGFFNSPEFKELSDSFGVNAIEPRIDKASLEGIESYVDRFYRLVLKREYDEAGFHDWVINLRTQIKSPEEIAKGFLSSREYINQNEDNNAFLETCYQALFGRNSDEIGKTYWLNKLNNQGFTREQVLNGFLSSKEFTNLVESFNLNELSNILSFYVKDSRSFLTQFNPKELISYTSDIIVKDNIAYVSDLVNGLLILDVSNTNNPILIDSYTLQGNTKKLLLSNDNNRLYVLNDYYGLIIFDISNLSSITQLSNYQIQIGNHCSMVMSDDNTKLFLANYQFTYQDGFMIFDVSSSSPNLIGSYHGNFHDVKLSANNDIAYLTEPDYGLHILDISIPGNPKLVNVGYNTNNFLLSLELSKDKTKAYVIEDEVGLRVLDITSHFFKVIGTYPLKYSTANIALSDDESKVFLSNTYNDSIISLNITDPQNITLLDTQYVPDKVNKIIISEDQNKLFLADSLYGMVSIDLKNPPNNSILASFKKDGFKYSKIIFNKSKTKAFLLDLSKGLTVLDISEVNNIKEIASFLDISFSNTGYLTSDFTLSFDEKKGYLLSSDGLIILDISDLSNITQIAHYREINDGSNIIVSKNNRFIFKDPFKIYIFEIDDMDNINVSSYDIRGVEDIKLSNDESKIYFTAGYDGLTILDISVLSDIKVINTFNTYGYASNFELSKDMSKIYISNGYKGVLTLDISDLEDIEILNTYPASEYVYDITLSNNEEKIYISDINNAIKVVDIKDISNFKYIFKHNLNGDVESFNLSLDDSKALILDNNEFLVKDLTIDTFYFKKNFDIENIILSINKDIDLITLDIQADNNDIINVGTYYKSSVEEITIPLSSIPEKIGQTIINVRINDGLNKVERKIYINVIE